MYIFSILSTHIFGKLESQMISSNTSTAGEQICESFRDCLQIFHSLLWVWGHAVA
jgi:hypothetical protein